ncbi:RINT1-like protein MAG2L isoform X2 [Cornus florida]|uniref:RINT1-like protein MAG2L isoform X2 n=1 Tax=Cornus florida TaxID=4283 RepID=UPI00289EECBB|nr:RINT1-like protein MAG2L isoform X2 [Cornus florida]
MQNATYIYPSNLSETTLKVEALVGDLEDAVFSVMKRQNRNIFSAILSNSSISTDLGARQEKLLQALKAMNDIEEVLVTVVKIHPDWLCLMKSVDTRVDKTLAVLRPQVLADHRALLASLGWPPKILASKIESGKIQDLPNPLVLMQADKSKTYSESFLALCALQHLQSRRDERQLNILRHKERDIGLWAIDELVSPIASRTEYHFSKWLDQPELMFALVYKITRDFILGVDDVLQPLIDRARLVSYSAKEAWVHGMIQMLSGFLEKRVFSVLAERYKENQARQEVISSWLHLIDLIIKFDKQMQSLMVTEAQLFGGSEGFSRGISVFSIFCDRPDWLKIWAKIELKDACKKLKVESKDKRAWLVDNRHGTELHIAGTIEEFLLYSREDHKAPLIAESALKIAWEMIERSQTLPTILPRSQFIRLTSARFLWYFFDVLLWHCKGTEFHSDVLDDDSLTRVCISVNAARYCESKLQEWSDDVSFLEMRITENVSNCPTEDDASDNRCFFEEEIKILSELETSWLMEIITDLLQQFETLSWEYVQINEHGGREQREVEAVNFTISVEFVEALDTIRSHLNVIRTSLNPKDFSDLWRSVANGLDHFIFRSILMSDNRFSDQGINQFGADMQALFVIFQPFCARPEAFFPCIRDSLKLLKMDKEDVRHLKVILLGDEDRMNYLRCSGISHVSFDQAWRILRNSKFKI